MKNGIVIILSGLLISSGSLFAQGIDGGYLTRLSGIKSSDMVNLSNFNRSMGTARSSAMGGAFTSLGADMSSMSINPAGLGMYVSSEFSVSPSLNIASSSNSRNGGIINDNDNKTTFGLDNMGVALNIYQSSGSITSITIGFGYNKLANFNSSNRYEIAPNGNSIGQVFAGHLAGTTETTLSSNPYDNLSPDFWGGVLAYNTGVVGLDTGTSYKPLGVAPGAINNHLVDILNDGSIGEYNISMGMNLSNVIYVGFSLGIKDINYNTNVYYREEFGNNEGAPADANNIYQMEYSQDLTLKGSGVDFKAGVIVQPLQGFRIGLAIHTPSYVDLDGLYKAGMRRETIGTGGKYTWKEDNTYDYFSTTEFTSPTRLLTGISYMYKTLGILSFDYERAWYNNIRLKGDVGNAADGAKDEVKDFYKGQDNFRVGLEIRPSSMFFLRAGYTYSGSMLRDDTLILDSPVAIRQESFSAGAGGRFGKWAVDLSYVMMDSDYSEYDLYNYGDITDPIITGGIKTALKNHFITLTTSVKF